MPALPVASTNVCLGVLLKTECSVFLALRFDAATPVGRVWRFAGLIKVIVHWIV
jgi:hypothetical protein